MRALFAPEVFARALLLLALAAALVALALALPLVGALFGAGAASACKGATKFEISIALNANGIATCIVRPTR